MVRPHLTRALSGDAFTFDNEVRITDVSIRLGRVSLVPHRDPGGCIRGVVVLVNDLTDTKTVERALRKSEQMLERSQSAAHVGSWEVDLPGAGWSRPKA